MIKNMKFSKVWALSLLVILVACGQQQQAPQVYGYEFLKKCNKNPYAMVLSFKKLQQLQGKSSSKSSVINQLFSTHPELEKRIEKMEKRAKSDGYIK